MSDVVTAVELPLFADYRLRPDLSREGLEALGCSAFATRDVVRIDAIALFDAFSAVADECLGPEPMETRA